MRKNSSSDLERMCFQPLIYIEIIPIGSSYRNVNATMEVKLHSFLITERLKSCPLII